MRRLIIAMLAMMPALLHAQDYNVALIPDSLKENANVVKRFEEVKVIIRSTSRAVVRRKYALTILNEEGQRYGGYGAAYSKMISLGEVDGNLYDAAGKKIKSVKKKEIGDYSYDDEMSLITDDRLKRHQFYYSMFPYTIEYEDEQEFDGTFFLPRYQPIRTEKHSVQSSKFIVEMPEGYELRYKCLNISTPQVATARGTKTMVWQLNNVSAMRWEPLQPDWDEVAPTVLLAPNDFEFGGYKGNMNSWHSLGKYMSTLYEGRNVLPENIKAEVRNLTANITDQKEKIRLVYEYMQKNTRYIGIQLGIGGWQPFEASFVATKRYGDCKALSNYTVSLLKEAGVKAYPVIINSGKGERGLFEDFPAPNFNHVVMCVPGKDTTWLECTSQTAAAGYMGSSTGNRKALMLGDDGGYVVSTPRYGIGENKQNRFVSGVIDTEGNLKANVFTYFTGEQQELQHSLINDANKEQREKYLNQVISLPTYKVNKFDYKEQKSALPVVEETLEISAPGYAAISGRRLFVVPNLFNKQSYKLPVDHPRKFNIELVTAFHDVDTLKFQIPTGYTPEAMAKDMNLKNKFGHYQVNYKVEGNLLTVIRQFQRNRGVYPPSDYPELVKFYDDIYKADRSKLVFVKAE